MKTYSSSDSGNPSCYRYFCISGLHVGKGYLFEQLIVILLFALILTDRFVMVIGLSGVQFGL